MWTLWSVGDVWVFLLAFQKYSPLKLIDQLEKEEKVQIIAMYLRQEWEGVRYFFLYWNHFTKNIFEKFLQYKSRHSSSKQQIQTNLQNIQTGKFRILI